MFGNDWDEKLRVILNSKGFSILLNSIKDKYQHETIYPKYEDIFRSLKITSYGNTRVVIIGQDPYHGENEATGLSFSVANGIKIPPSLLNIYKELNSDLGIKIPNHGDLTSWAKEGVLLLNSVLTVKKDVPNSHKNLGWEIFTDYIIKVLNEKESPIVFILWGNYAKSKKKLINTTKHLVIESSHPSPFSANYGFFGSKPFSKTNKFLKKNNLQEINWEIKF